MGTGVFETFTFPFSAPREYRPIILPEYPWQAEGPEIL
jgi:hypothetical protein